MGKMKEAIKRFIPDSPKKALLDIMILSSLYSIYGCSKPTEKSEKVICQDGVCTLNNKKGGEDLDFNKQEFAIRVEDRETPATDYFDKLLESYDLQSIKFKPSSKEYADVCSKLGINIRETKWPTVILIKNGKCVGKFLSNDLEKNIINSYGKKNLNISGRLEKEIKNKREESFRINYKNLKEIINNDFSYAEKSDKIVIDFYALWCGPCSEYAPNFERILEKYPQVKCARVNIDNNKNIAKKYGIKGIPATIFLQNGKEIDRFIGYDKNWEKTELEARIKKHYLK